MRKTFARTLCLLLTLSMLPAAAFAGTIQLFGSGTKTMPMQIPYGSGTEYTLYDIYGGAKTRQDTRDFDNFIRKALTATCDVPGHSLSHSQVSTWNSLALNVFGDMVKTKWKDQTLRQFCSSGASSNYVLDINHTKGAQACDVAIRSNFAEMTNSVFGTKNTADYFKPISGLAELGFTGDAFFATAYHYKKGIGAVAYGAIFYDIQSAYIEDGQPKASGAGTETDLSKLSGKRGVTIDVANPEIQSSTWVDNHTKETMQQTKSIELGHSSTMTNSITQTEQTTSDWRMGGEMEIANSFPFFKNFKITLKSEYGSSWMSSTQKGQSESKEESVSEATSVSANTPPHTALNIDTTLIRQNAEVQYDYPIALTYKVALFAIMDKAGSELVAVFGEKGDADNQTAFQNLRNRYEHRNNSGYEAVHGSGHPIPWGTITPSMSALRAEDLAFAYTYVPMSITGGMIGVKEEVLSFKTGEPVPLSPIKYIDNESDADTFALKPDATLKLQREVALGVYDEGIVDFYGFNVKTHGAWAFCDENGDPATTDLATIDARGVLKAGDEPGTVYVKYFLDEEQCRYIAYKSADGRTVTYGYSKNEDVDNDSLVRIDIKDPLDTVTQGYRVILAGELQCDLNRTVTLPNRYLKLAIQDSAGALITTRQFPVDWKVDGVVLSDNEYTATVPGKHKVQAGYAGCWSNEVDLTVFEGDDALRVEMDKAVIKLDKGASASLSAKVYPANAQNTNLQWTSADESIVTVDENGRVFAQGTGYTTVTASTADGKASAHCRVIVLDADPGATLAMGKVALAKGDTLKLKAPGNARGTWRVKDEQVATVTSQGKIQAKALGETELVFDVESANESAEFLGKAIYAGDSITVPLVVRKPGKVVTSIKAKKTLTMVPGEHRTLESTVKPAKATDQEVFYETSDKQVVMISDHGTLIAVGTGKATITITACSGVSRKVTVEVTDQVTGISLNKKKKTLNIGESYAVYAMPIPEGFEGTATMRYESSKPEVATVDDEGVVTAVSKGKTTITVTTGEGDNKVSAKCVITVK